MRVSSEAVIRHLGELMKRRFHQPKAVAVKTWCRKCGLPVLLKVYLDYEKAVDYFYALDDQPMGHRGVHEENGGWGIHWRLDEVLSALFPQHTHENWPKPQWYDGDAAEQYNVIVMEMSKLADEVSEEMIDVELRMMVEAINRNPKTRDELAQYVGEVWDTSEFADRFEVLGFRAPFAIVREIETGKRGSLLFQNHPRFYFGFSEDRSI